MRTWSMLPLVVLSASCLPLSNQANGEHNVLTFNQEVVFDAVPAALSVNAFGAFTMKSLHAGMSTFRVEADGHLIELIVKVLS